MPVLPEDSVLMMNIRLAQETDLDSILEVIETAFPDEENKVIMNLVQDLHQETASPSMKSLVAEVDNQAIGYVYYSPIFLKSDTSISGYILAPLAVSPEHKNKGVGSNLINAGIDMLTNDGVGVLLVYGDPAYYGRFGFKEENRESEYGIVGDKIPTLYMAVNCLHLSVSS